MSGPLRGEGGDFFDSHCIYSELRGHFLSIVTHIV